MLFKKEEKSLKEVKLGLIPSPDLPAELTSKFIDDFPKFLSTDVDDSVTWKPKIVIDPLVGTAEDMKQLMDKATYLKYKNNWDYVICLTDLPQFMEKHVVMADINSHNQVALVSIPSFGAFPMKQRIKRTIAHILGDMHHQKSTMGPQMGLKKRSKKPFFSSIHRIDLQHNDNKPEEAVNKEKREQYTDGYEDEQTQEDTEEQSDIRYIIKSKPLGRLRILIGMTFANRPWTALISFRKILMLAFGTGIYITIFPSSWELSAVYSIERFVVLMFVAIIGMVTWIIFAHKLWEKPSQKGDVRLRKLYNYTTITTLFVIVLINYIVLYCLFLATISIFVPPRLFEVVTDLNETPSIKYYFLFTWLITSLGTLAGSIGTASENEEKIRQITYSYRQINRYYEIDNENDEENKQNKI